MNKTAEKVAKLLIGEKVKRLYTQQALSQKEIAAKASVDVKTMQRLENGETAKGDTLRRVAEALNVPVTEFSMWLGLDNGSIAQMSLPELNSLKMSLSELSENRKINREEHDEIREIIEMAEKQKANLILPPLPPPPAGAENLESEMQPNVPLELLEELNLFDAIKRVMTETKPWARYAPADKNQPTLAHKLREKGFIAQPCIGDFGPYRVGLFKQGKMDNPSPSLYLAIHTRDTTEGLVILLSPPRLRGNSPSHSYLPIFYRSLNNNQRFFKLNFELYNLESLEGTYGEPFLGLLNTTMTYNPNFKLTGGKIGTSFMSYGWSEDSYMFNRMIRIEKLNPFEIAWGIDFEHDLASASRYWMRPLHIWLIYNHPLNHGRRQISVELNFDGNPVFDKDLNLTLRPSSRLSITWPKEWGKTSPTVSKFGAKLSAMYHLHDSTPNEPFDLPEKHKKDSFGRKKIDLVTLTDETPSNE